MSNRPFHVFGFVLLAAVLAVFPPTASAAAADEVEIPFTKFVLDNGLTLIVHEDHKAPIVAINVWYHVGSKDEKLGRTGFAHLFEHLMFNGTEHYDDDYFKVLERLGATDMNGTTNTDRTNYFQNVPTSALDVVLWMESERMGHLLGAIDQAKLDEQRGVVKNEKRQGENQPYALSRELIASRTYPKGHPYSWTTIGFMEDLDAAKVDDVHEWFKRYYGAANATLVLAGDIDPQAAKHKVEQYFGDIPAGPPVPRLDTWVAPLAGPIRERALDRVPHARIYKVWNVAAGGTAASTHLDLAAAVLSSGKTSRLFKRLVYDEQIARDVSAFVDTREIGGQFRIQATAQPGENLERIEREIDEELARLGAEGPTAEELERVKTQRISALVRGIERIGGFGGKSDILAASMVYGGRPDYYKTSLDQLSAATPADVQAAVREWLGAGVYALEIHPFPAGYRTVESTVDRSKVPQAGDPPAARFPKLARATLSSGLKLIVAERHAVPLVDFNLLVDAGFAADASARPGTAQLAMNMLDEGTATRSALAISEELDRLGARLGTGSNLDVSSVSLSAMKSRLDESLALMADVLLHPAFPERELERLRKQQLTAIEAEKTQPQSMGQRVLPALMYGADHPYGNPFSGTGTKESVTAIRREDLVAFHSKWLVPGNSTLVVVGDTTLDEIRPKLEALFASWKPGKAPQKTIADVGYRSGGKVYLIDKPGAVQSVIIAGHVAPPRGVAEDVALEALNGILGGSFTGRINMNLREARGWSYGSRSQLVDARGQRPFLAVAPVQTDKTAESMKELLGELTGIRGSRPITADELSKVQAREVLRLPGSWETNAAVGGSIEELVRFGLPDDYFDRWATEVRTLTLAQVAKVAQQVVRPDDLIWVVVGDRSKIEQAIRDQGFGDVALLDADGRPLDAVARR